MNIRLAIILSGSLLVGASGGLVAALPLIYAAGEAPAPVERAPSPDLEMSRVAVLSSLRATSAGIAERAEQLELLAGLMAETGGSAESAPRAVSLPVSDQPIRRDPIRNW